MCQTGEAVDSPLLQRIGWLLCAALLLAACSPHAVGHRPAAPLRLPDDYISTRTGGQTLQGDTTSVATTRPGPVEDGSWNIFRDPALTRLVEQAIAGNFDLKVAHARRRQAGALVDLASAPRFPVVGLSVGAGYQRLNQARFGLPGGGLDIFGAAGSLEASYEVDLWRRFGSARQATLLDKWAAAEQLQVATTTVVTEVAEAYYDVIAAQAERQLLLEQRKLSASLLSAVEERFGRGMANAVELHQQRQQVLEVESALSQLLATEKVALLRLVALLGVGPDCPDAPGQVEAPASARGLPVAGIAELAACLNITQHMEIPSPPQLPAAGVPATLLQRRADVRAAQRAVEAADYRVAAAVAARYPSLRLTGALSSEPSEINEWLFDPLWNLTVGLTFPLLDGGQGRAEVELQEGAMAEALSRYGAVVLRAIVEVEIALTQAQQQQYVIDRVSAQLQAAKVTFEQAEVHYGRGTADFLDALTALRSQQTVERTLLAAQRQLLSYRIALSQALGGGWASTRSAKRSAPRESP